MDQVPHLPFGPRVRIFSTTNNELEVRALIDGRWEVMKRYNALDDMALHHATLRALDIRRALLEGEDPHEEPDGPFSLHWAALNYRTAASQHAQPMYEELERTVDRLIKRGWR